MSRSDNRAEAARLWVVRHWSALHPTRSGNRIRRPLNCFMLFRTYFVQNLMHLAEYNTPDVQGTTTSFRASKAWSRLTQEERDIWAERGRAWAERHATLFPNYKFSPRRNNAQALTNSPPPSYLRTRRRSSSVPPMPTSVPFQSDLSEPSDVDPASLPGSPQLDFAYAPVPEGWTGPSFVGAHPNGSQIAIPNWPEHMQAYVDFNTGAHFLDSASSLSSPTTSTTFNFDNDYWVTPAAFNDPWQVGSLPAADDSLSAQLASHPGPAPGSMVHVSPYAPFPGAPFIPEGNYMIPAHQPPPMPSALEPFPLVPSNAPVEQEEHRRS
ncbi:hypothetical protein EXIGLDRAFT_772132 [Exidia glandulosa HHB12029]|uniref:HMG box domain-containing protein n=1 Tax=Exidia glandulosa HHB12029 TaxID=1314781 RepID=A0A165FIH2_EXIGL|nr:hypothetical protein EXIGLDRAFT_772132 [Exidia glandulosa HHB12029]